jgi:2-polyprenyl-3-methyl-5-hydroxy-6-metoxy-1,4-benzoquinol methylase
LLKDTGERVIPELMKPTNPLLLEHIARYYFSFPYIKGRILDIASGVGYGTQLIAKAHKDQIDEIIGVDIDKEAIAYAKHKYYHPLVKFEMGDAADPQLPKKLGQFDVILSFETLEHIENEEQFMKNIYQMLKPGGTLIISTPFGEGRGKPCNWPFHVHQLTKEEFIDLFKNYSKVDIYYQRGVLIEPPREGMYYPIGVAVCVK